MPYIGSRIKRKEDVRLLRGIGKYVGDIHRTGMAHAAILRSTHAHARIVKIDVAAALKLPGVVGVLTAADMPGLKTIPMRTGVIPGLERSQQTPIATRCWRKSLAPTSAWSTSSTPGRQAHRRAVSPARWSLPIYVRPVRKFSRPHA